GAGGRGGGRGGGADPLADPAVDVGERLSGFLHLSLTLPQPAQAGRCPELPRLRGLPSGRVDRCPEAGFGRRRRTCPESPTLRAPPSPHRPSLRPQKRPFPPPPSNPPPPPSPPP